MKPRTLLASICGALLALLGVVSYAYEDLAHETRKRASAAHARGYMEGLRASADTSDAALTTCVRKTQALGMRLRVMEQRRKLRMDE